MRALQRLGVRLIGEGTGTAFLLAAVVGSGIMGERLSVGNPALALLANTLATGAALVALILSFGPICGAHFNPVVTLLLAIRREHPWRQVLPYVLVQVLGALAGVLVANVMFEGPAFSLSTHERAGPSQVLSEAVATFGLLLVIVLCGQHRPGATPFAVGAYITAAYWFTASTSFANPAVTIARSLTNTFCGIQPGDVPGFVLGQILGAAGAGLLLRFLVHPGKDGDSNVAAP